MIINENEGSEKSIAIFNDVVLQTKMGQWLCIIPSSQKKGNFLSYCIEPCNAELLVLENKVSHDKLSMVELEFAKVLKLFGLEDNLYLIKDYNQKNNSFTCIQSGNMKSVMIKFKFNDIVTLPSEFIVDYGNSKIKYNFITDKNKKSNMLMSKEKKSNTGMGIVEKSNLNWYDLSINSNLIHVNIEYNHQLKEVDKTNQMINTFELSNILASKNISIQNMFDISQIVRNCLKCDIGNFRKIEIDFNQQIDGKKYRNELSLLNNRVEKLKILNNDSSMTQQLEIENIFKRTTIYEEINKNRK